MKSAIKCQLADSQADPLQSDPAYSGPVLSSLVAPSIDEVQKLLSLMPVKSSPTDCIPTIVLKFCADVFAPLIGSAVFRRRSFSYQIQSGHWPV